MSKIDISLIQEMINNLYKEEFNFQLDLKIIEEREVEYNNETVFVKDFIDLNTGKTPVSILNGKLTWSAYIDKKTDVTFFVIDNGFEILYVSQGSPQLPSSYFKVGVYECGNTDSIGVFISLKDEVDEFSENTRISNEELRAGDVAGFENIFEENGFKLMNEEENTFALYFKELESGFTIEDAFENGDYDSHIIPTNDENINQVKSLLLDQLKMEYSEELELY